MGEFKPIETQEQLDALIGERLKREKETLGKKYEGYISPEDFEVKSREYGDKIDSLTKQLNEANGEIITHKGELEKKDAIIKGYESHSVKTRIAQETGLPLSAVDFLTGDDEKSIKTSAEALKGIIAGSKQAPPLADTDGNSGNGSDAALRSTLKSLTKGD
jgi:hypothetical protein